MRPVSAGELFGAVLRLDERRPAAGQLLLPTEKIEGEAEDSRAQDVRRDVLSLRDGLGDDDIRSLSQCLVCMRCTAACPSGVEPHRLLLAAKVRTVTAKGLPVLKSVALRTVISNEALHGAAFSLGNLGQRLGLTHLVPKALLPRGINLNHFPLSARPFRKQVPEVNPTSAEKERVAFFVGCMIDHSLPNVGHAVMRVLHRAGVGVIVPRELGCCGIPLIVNGDLESARHMVAHNLVVLSRLPVSHIITACASCGNALKQEYPELMQGTPLAEAAEAVAQKATDISTYLADHLDKAQLGPLSLSVTYHDPCHLVRGQWVSAAPREVIQSIPGVEFREMAEADLCCGAGGSFQAFHPDLAWRISERKMKNVADTGADAVVTACPGCVQRLQGSLREMHLPQTTRHIVELVDQAILARGWGQSSSRPTPRPDTVRSASLTNTSVASREPGRKRLGSLGSGVDQVGESVLRERIWSCTTCDACVEACPAMVRPRDLVQGMRRHLVEKGEVPDSAARSLDQTLLLGSPWGQPRSQRTAWARDSSVRVLKPGDQVDYLFWVGDLSAFDLEAQAVARAMVEILNVAGASYGILGGEEQSDGEVARRLGEEGLFRVLARTNIGILKQYRFKSILTHCPHSYNTFKNEYREIGGEFEVLHHSDFLYGLLKDGVVRPTRPVEERVTYHDPCYLGRHNHMYDVPRQVLHFVSGLELVEMPRSRETSLCCGAGGGAVWGESVCDQRLNYVRFEEVEAVDARTVATACPYCKMMLCDAAVYRQVQNKIRVRDISEIILETRPERVK